MNAETAKILPIIEKPVVNAAEAAAGALVGAFESIADANEQLAEWAGLAIMIQNDDGSSTVSRRLEYPVTQQCQLWHNMLYGNRPIWKTDSKGELVLSYKNEPMYLEPTDDQLKSQNVRFCATENLNYWETRNSRYQINENGQVIYQTTLDDGTIQTGIVPEDDLAYANVTLKTEEARRWHAYVTSTFNGFTKAYEVLTGSRFMYKPFAEKARAGSNATNAVALAASLRKKG